MHRRQLLALVVALAGSTGCAGDDQAAPPIRRDADVRLSEHRLVRSAAGTNRERVAVEGGVSPVEDSSVGYVELEVAFLDRVGDVLDRKTGTVEEFDDPPWGFRIAYPYVGERAAAVHDYEIGIGTVL